MRRKGKRETRQHQLESLIQHLGAETKSFGLLIVEKANDCCHQGSCWCQEFQQLQTSIILKKKKRSSNSEVIVREKN